MKNICVFVGANNGHHSKYLEAAMRLGREIAARKMGLIYGGANVGLMGALADSALEAGAKVVGIMPECLITQEIAHKNLTQSHIVNSMQERKVMMANLADAFIALPGGLGTLEETFEVWNAIKIGLYNKPFGFLNVDGYFNTLFDFLTHASENGFIKKAQLELITHSNDPSALLDIMTTHLIANTP